jgi:hypothetical protein
MRAIPYVALIIGVLVAAIGIFGLAAPEEFVPLIGEAQKRLTIYGIAAVRVAIGVVLLLAAGTSRAPFLLGAIGIVIMLGGFATLFMPGPLRQSVERWMADGSLTALRTWCVVALVLGVFVVRSTLPKRKK